jgi:hypothetical protein
MLDSIEVHAWDQLSAQLRDELGERATRGAARRGGVGRWVRAALHGVMLGFAAAHCGAFHRVYAHPSSSRS